MPIKITDRDINGVLFEELAEGEVFEYAGNFVYIKIKEIKDDENTYNCVNLSDGSLHHLSKGVEVLIKAAELIIR